MPDLDACWVDPGYKEARAEIRPDYEIEQIGQLESLLAAVCRDDSCS